MEKNLIETAIPSEYTMRMKDFNFQWVADDTPALATIFFTSIATYLAIKKNRDQSVGIKLTTDKGAFLFGAVVNYVPNEEDEALPSNLDLSMTFDEDKFKPDQELTCNDQAFINVFLKTGERLYGMAFKSMHYISDMLICLIQTIRVFLDTNAKADEACNVLMPKCGSASVEVQDDKKVFTFVPDEHLKQIVKDDSIYESL